MRQPKSSVPNLDEGTWSPEQLEHAFTNLTQWMVMNSGMFKATTMTRPQTPAGAYAITLDRNDDSPLFVPKRLATDDLMHFKDSLSDQILSEITNFWTKQAAFKASGFLHRRGYLLYGSQGTGKSSIVQQIMADVVSRGGVVLICGNPFFFTKALSHFRQVEPNRPVVCIFEDIDAIIKRYGEDEILAILDGANQVDRVLNIATTNYPETLDKRIVSRPRRFDRVIKILPPGDKVRATYLKAKLPKKANFKDWFVSTAGLSFAGLTEALISVLCLGNKLDDTVKILKDLENGHPSSDDFGSKIGFATDTPDVDAIDRALDEAMRD